MSHITILDQFVHAVENGDEQKLRELYHPDAKIWHNDGMGDQDIEANLEILRLMHANIAGLAYDVRRQSETTDGVYQQHLVRGTLPNGSPVDIDACIFMAIEDGKIVRIEEFFDASRVQQVLSAVTSQD